MRQSSRTMILAFLVGLVAASQAFAGPQGHRQPGRSLQAADATVKISQDRIVQSESVRIMSVLDDRIEDPDVLAKTRDKLLTLPVGEIRLISSLCDRVSTGERTARADIAFSLVTALIVLS